MISELLCTNLDIELWKGLDQSVSRQQPLPFNQKQNFEASILQMSFSCRKMHHAGSW